MSSDFDEISAGAEAFILGGVSGAQQNR